MRVFKNYLKVAKSFLPIILIYTLIFVGIATIASTSGSSQGTDFEASKAKIALVNNDQDTEFIKLLRQYVQDNAEYIELDNDEESMRDALFFRKVDYIMIVPQDFTHQFMNNQDVKIKTMDVPDSYGAKYSQTLMNKYLNTVKLYLSAHISEKDIAENVKKDLAIHTEVTMLNEKSNEQITDVAQFYNFANYTFLAIIIVVISMVMIAFYEDKIKRRHLVSCLPYKNINNQLLLGNIVTSLGVWLLYVMLSICLYGSVMFTTAGLLMILNSFIFVIFVLVFSFFVTSLTHNRELISGISTVAGLGTSFIAGAFVPQAFLAPFVLNLAKFTPSYWYISNNNEIAQMTSFSFENLQTVFVNIGVMIIFTIGFYILMQFISYLKLKK